MHFLHWPTWAASLPWIVLAAIGLALILPGYFVYYAPFQALQANWIGGVQEIYLDAQLIGSNSSYGLDNSQSNTTTYSYLLQGGVLWNAEAYPFTSITIQCTPSLDPTCFMHNKNSFTITIATIQLCFDARDPASTLSTSCSLDTSPVAAYSALFFFGALALVIPAILMLGLWPCTLVNECRSKHKGSGQPNGSPNNSGV